MMRRTPQQERVYQLEKSLKTAFERIRHLEAEVELLRQVIKEHIKTLELIDQDEEGAVV